MTAWLVFFLVIGFAALCIAVAVASTRRFSVPEGAIAFVEDSVDALLLGPAPAQLPVARVVRGGR